MLLSIASLLVGLVLLVWSADLFVDGASATAVHLGVSTLVIGITIIGFGTSAPEILISLISVFDGTPDLAIGNALGSNIANIGLILGASALFMPLAIASRVIRKEYPLLIVASALMTYCLWDLTLTWVDGLLLLGFLSGSMLYTIYSGRVTHTSSQDSDPFEDEVEQEINKELSLQKALMYTLFGLLVLVGSSKLLVYGATDIALRLGISELVIGLTIVALGTSLPELAASIASVKKGETDLVIGNVVGSNLFNSLAVIGIPALLTQFQFSSIAIERDLPITLGFTLVLFLLIRFPITNSPILGRLKGFVLLTGFVLYQFLLYYQSTQ